MTESTSRAFTFEFTALLTVALALETETFFFISKEVHSFDVGWAFSLAHTDKLLDLLLFTSSFGSETSVISFSFHSSTGFHDLVQDWIIRKIGISLV
jgi:hypothetical protein